LFGRFRASIACLKRYRGRVASGDQGQGGATLIELVASMSVVMFIAGAAGMSLYQIRDTSNRNNERFTALHEVDNAHYWVAKDARSALSTDLVDGGPPVAAMTLSWTDGGGGPHSSSYSLSGTQLRRNYDGAVLTVARHLSSMQFSLSGQLITVSLVSSPGMAENDEARDFYVYLRPQS